MYTVIAGPNGSGKTKLAKLEQLNGNLGLYINPDSIARELPPGTANPDFAARNITVERTRQLLAAGESFARESAFSGKTIMRSIEEAKRTGYRVQVVFVAVEDVEEAIARVSVRVAQGGHDIPEEEQRRRFDLTIQNAATAARSVDQLVLFDNPRNSDFQRVAQVEHGKVTMLAKNRPLWVDRVVIGLERQPASLEPQETPPPRRSVPVRKPPGAEQDDELGR